jgi:hypothetical protein
MIPHALQRLRPASGTWACSARCYRDAPGAAQPWAARRRSAADHVGGGGRDARAARLTSECEKKIKPFFEMEIHLALLYIDFENKFN